MELNSLFLKFFCCIIWFDGARLYRPYKRGLYVKSYCFFGKIAWSFKNYKLIKRWWWFLRLVLSFFLLFLLLGVSETDWQFFFNVSSIVTWEAWDPDCTYFTGNTGKCYFRVRKISCMWTWPVKCFKRQIIIADLSEHAESCSSSTKNISPLLQCLRPQPSQDSDWLHLRSSYV